MNNKKLINEIKSNLNEANSQKDELDKILNEIKILLIRYLENIELNENKKFNELSLIFKKLGNMELNADEYDINRFMQSYKNNYDKLVQIRKELQTLLGFTGR